MASKRVLILSFSHLHSDPRVLRQITWFRRTFNVTAAGLSDPSIVGVEYRQLRAGGGSLLSKLFQSVKKLVLTADGFYWTQKHIAHASRELSKEQYDLIICNDIEALPLGLRWKNNAKVIFDAHEYAPLHFEHLWHWRVLNHKLNTHLCKKYIPLCDAMTTVSPGLARGYYELTGKKATLITSAPEYHDLEPRPVGNKIKLIHHGAANRARNIEDMIGLAEYLDDRFELYFILVPSSRNYIKVLKKKASKYKNIFFLDPVPTKDLPAFLNGFDIGLFLVAPVTFNLLHTLPNKLFEFIQARLAVAIGPSPDMSEVVGKYHLGIVSDDFTSKSLALALNTLTAEDIMAYKSNSHCAAQIECADENENIMTVICESLIGGVA